MKKTTILIAITFLLLTSCSKITVLRTTELLSVQSHIDSLTLALYEQQEKFNLEQQKEFKSFKINQEITLQTMNEKLDMLSGNIDESQARISDISKNTGVLTDHWKERAQKDSLSKSQVENERLALFDQAKNDYNAGHFTVALEEFAIYAEKYPESEEIATVNYWIAETHFAIAKYKESEEQFRKYIKENVDGEFRCSSFYKLGVIFGKQGKKGHRDKVWAIVTKECPDSKEATLIKSKK
jgi:TolA-binding protein